MDGNAYTCHDQKKVENKISRKKKFSNKLIDVLYRINYSIYIENMKLLYKFTNYTMKGFVCVRSKV